MQPEQSPAAKLNTLTLERNIPVSVTIELTRRCPLSCRHCYLPETRGRAAPGSELPAAQWGKILAQLAEAGALYLVFTGGEPLLRPDLAELCARAKKLKFDVRIFSTGLGMDGALALKLKKAGVSGFEISFYGRAQIHDAITGLKGSFEGSLSASRLLKKAGIKVRMKIPLMKTNLPQIGWLKALAKREGFGISFDPVITAASDGDDAALKFRLSSRQLAKAVNLLSLSSSLIPHPSSLPSPPSPPSVPLSFSLHPSAFGFPCGAGRNVCAVDPGGELYPCLQLPVKLGNLKRERFAGLWKNSRWLKKWRSVGVKEMGKCASCPHIDFCSRCPGVSLIEEGDVFAPNKPACAMANALYQKSSP
ncbi:MAG: hypothetical protein A2X28_04765 [Elusimicrobia bacterium GWA2_56_46]|nr:MAG: hypothetical protein A2X28_04765 [Elusimicrobia bacterium GWA2_56_46]OGR56183.1 MAG: hypothetical protein A2X39_08185 [Elusimicrobia bacterium GWC2_56_31]HBB66900.1 hypothetical protein [Elusimicrobiota bacterium]HBW23040.1 hypothetical protein [Elusimicrobiota bacterium]